MTYFTQHIRVAGQFYWENDQKQKMIEDVRLQLIDEVRQRMSHPNPTTDAIVDMLANLSNWPRRDIQTLIIEPIKTNESQFVKLMQELQTLRKLL